MAQMENNKGYFIPYCKIQVHRYFMEIISDVLSTGKWVNYTNNVKYL
jgi:hypothetical protein